MHEALGSILGTTKEQKNFTKRLALRKFPPFKRGFVYRGDFTPKDSG